MVDEFFLKSLIQITHGEIRLIDKEREIRRIEIGRASCRERV